MMNDKKNPTELDTFLDGTTKDGVLTPKFKVQVAPRTGDLENGPLDEKAFDPFTERRVEKPTTDCDTLTHLLKAALGTGILAMPVAFKNAGLLVGIFATILVAFVCTHCAYILVKCAHVLYYKTKRTQMSFADVSEAALSHGPQWIRRFALPSRYMIQVSLFVTYYLTCSVYTVIIQKNLVNVLDIYVTNMPSQRVQIAFLLVPIILICLVPNLKYLAPFSALANVLMGIGLGITFYFIVVGMESMSDKRLIAPLSEFPVFFSITIFAMEAIGVIMPLENNMATPQHFVGICGVLNKGMTGVTFVYILLGFLGYARYGDKTEDSITLNLDPTNVASQIVLVCIAVAVFCTLALQFYVCVDIAWAGIKDRYTKRPQLANCVLRIILATGAVSIAVAVPTIGPFLNLIGAFCFSILGLLIPVFIETITYWDIGFGAGNWVAYKNVAVVIIGTSALIFGTRSALIEIAAMFSKS